MAERKSTFPMLPVAHWWALRRRFKQSIPGVVTDGYIATVLNMEARSARANVLPFLRVLGIIDEEGKPQERAKLWRDDDRYQDVCKSILQEVYPKELLDAVPDPRSDRSSAERWFAASTGAGQAAVNRMTALYTVLAEADASKGGENGGKARAEKARSGRRRDSRVAKPQPSKSPLEGRRQEGGGGSHPGTPQVPGVSINLEIHISSDASPDQIDQIFASMGKHIYRRG